MTVVADGEPPDEALERASPGETVVLDGRHEVASPVTLDVPGATVHGLDVVLADGAETNAVEVAADGVTLTGFRVDGNRAGQSGDRQSNGVVVAGVRDVTVADGRVRATSRHGLRVVDVAEVTSDATVPGETVRTPGGGPTRDVTVRDVAVESPRRDGCSVEGPDVAGVTVANVRTAGSEDRGGVEVKDGARDALVTGCRTVGCRYGYAVQDHGGHPVSNVRFLGNAAVGCETLVDAQTTQRHDGVVAVGNAGRDLGGDGMGGPGGLHLDDVDGVVAANNRLDGVGGPGIVVRDCPGATVAGNAVVDADGPGVAVRDCPGAGVADNLVRGAAGPGVDCLAGGRRAPGLQVTGNRCLDVADPGVRLRGALDRYLVATNLASVADAADGAGLVTDNLA